MRKLIWILSLMCAVLLSQALIAAQAQNQAKTTAPTPCTCLSNMDSLLNMLNLTPAQQAQINEIRDSAQKVKDTQKREILVIHNEILKITKVGKLDDAKLSELLDQKKEIVISMIKNKILTRQQIYNILTPPQKAKYDELMKNADNNFLDSLIETQGDLTS